MKIVIFYEKPGCATNAKQKKMLRDAGCMVIVRDLLHHGLNAEELYSFLQPYPMAQWFNPNAPQIKSGALRTTGVSESTALQLLLMEPILIRRPLMVIAGKKLCGFDRERVEVLLETKLGRTVPTACSSHTEVCAVVPESKEIVWK